ncbi:hypothetical protein ACFO4O_13545 [Glaciecola siphonariae]|uniref:Methyl-accepting chemotaxis protein n=1 Tax=Glaciecola siphonariae TaxID=521012 RepID=A0ABV9LZ68_9ALTE
MNLRESPHLLSRSALAAIGLTILLALSSVLSVSASTAKDALIDARIAKTQEFVATIKGRDLEAANALFDLFAFTERVAQHLRLEGNEKRAFTKGFYQGLQEQNLVS